jgi:hypothetical protein
MSTWVCSAGRLSPILWTGCCTRPSDEQLDASVVPPQRDACREIPARAGLHVVDAAVASREGDRIAELGLGVVEWVEVRRALVCATTV